MYNLQGIISKGTNNALIQFERFGQIANNLSNVNTTGYKKVTFEQILKEDGYLTGAVRTDHSQGSIRITSNPDGWLVGEGIQIPTNCFKFEIKPNGDVFAYAEKGDKPEKIGNIPLVRFDNPDGMESADMNRLVATADAGEGRLIKNHDCFKQNNLERANVSIYQSATDLLRLNASMLASMQMLKLADTMYNKSINIREG